MSERDGVEWGVERIDPTIVDAVTGEPYVGGWEDRPQVWLGRGDPTDAQPASEFDWPGLIGLAAVVLVAVVAFLLGLLIGALA